MKTLATVLVTTTLLGLLSACESNPNTEQPPAASSSSPKTTESSPVANSSSAKPSGNVTSIQVTEKDMEILLSSASAPAGPIEFVTKNTGPSPHELLVVKTDLAIDQLPRKGSVLDEKAKSIEVIDEIEEEDLPKGASKTLRVNLRPGKYLLICNIRGHFTAGMITPFTVT